MDKQTIEIDSYSSIHEMTSVNNENNRIAVEIELQGNNSLSQDLFDDEYSVLNSTCINSDQLINEPLESSVVDIFVTPIQNSKCLAGEQSSTIATIPTIPLSLVPFITATNESWTSDLETPQANAENPPIYHVWSDEQAKFSECKSAKRCSLDPADKILSHVSTPHGYMFACMDGQDISSSPVLNTKKKRRPKRRIMNTIETWSSVDSSCDKCDDIDISNEQICHPSSDNTNCDLSDQDANHAFIPEKTDQSNNDETANVSFIMNSEKSPVESLVPKTKDCSLDDTLGKYSNHEDSEDNYLNDTLDNDTTDVDNGENNEHNVTTVTNGGGTDQRMQSLLNRLEKLKELEETRRPLSDHNYVIIPLEEFTKDIHALQKAVMPPPGSSIRSNITKHLDFIPFSKLCASQEESSEICEDAGEIHTNKSKTDASQSFFNPNVYSSTSHQKFNSEKMESSDSEIDTDVNRAETVNAALDKPEKEMKTASAHTVESLGEIEEFSEWFYEPSKPTDSAQSSATVLVQNKEIDQEKGSLPSTDVTEHKDVHDCEIDIKQSVQINLQDFSNAEGFATASGKPIAINKDRLIKAVQLYNSCEIKADSQFIDSDCMVDLSIPSSTNNLQMLQTKKRKSDMDIIDLAPKDGNNEEQSLTTVDKPMKKSKMDIESADVGIPCNTLTKTSGNLGEITKHDVNKDAETSACTSNFSGFHTASGKTVEVKQSSLNKARALFDEACEAALIPTDENTLAETIRYKNEKSTISNPQRSIAENNLINPPASPMLETNFPVVTTGFNTASGSAIQVSNRALSKAKMLITEELGLMDCDFNSDKEFRKIHEQFPKSKNVPTSTEATQEELATVNCKSIETGTLASKKSLALCRADKSEIQNNNSTTLEDLSGNNITKNITNNDKGLTGTTTGKVVQSNHYSLNKSEIQCEDKNTERSSSFVNKITNAVPETNTPAVSTGFSTASGSVIQVSNQALLKAKAIVTEECNNYNLDSMEVDIDNEETLQNMFKEFSKTTKLSNSKKDIPKISPLKESVNKITPKPVNKDMSMTMMSASKSNSEYASDRVKSMINLQSRKVVAKNQFSEEKENAQNVISNNLSAAFKNCYPNKPDLSNYERNSYTPSIKKQIEIRPICENSDDSQKRNRFTDRIVLEPQVSHPSDKLKVLRQEENMPTFVDEVTASLEALLADEASLDTNLWTSSITCSPNMLQDREITMKPMTADQSDDITAVPASPILNSKPRAKLKTRKRKQRVQETIFDTSRIDTGLAKTSVANFPDDVGEKLDPTRTRNLKSHFEFHPDNSVGSLSIQQSKCIENIKSPTSSHGLEFPSEACNMQPEELVNILEKRIAAASAQEKFIEMKKKNKPQPLQGSLHLCKSSRNNHRISWKQFTKGAFPKQRTYDELMNLGIDPAISNVTASTALHYRFKCSTYYGEAMIRHNVNGVEVGDDAMLILDKNGHAGIEEFERAFMASPGVDPFLVPDGWIKNHYQWIVWKLASMDRTKFDDICTQRMLTPHHVMEQLKYRYDREIDRSERPVLRKIIEKDQDSGRRMVLCVATIDKITKSESSEKSSTLNWKIKLTDGWYGINASIDEAMSHHIATGKVREGTKLVIYGAELLNCSNACSPLEIPDDVCLHIHTNSTRRVRWDVKLGYQRDTGPISTSLSNIYVDGGLIGKLKAIVARVYPEQYYEKTADGRSVFRNSKCEQKIAIAYENQRDSQIEAMYEVAADNFEAKCGKQSISSSSSSISNEEFNNLDPFEIFQRQLEAKLRASLPAPRQVTLLLKVRLMQEKSTAVLTVWAPNEDIIDILREGNIISIRNIQTASRRWGELQLTAGRLSVIKYEKKEVLFVLERCCTTIPNVGLPAFNPPFAEFDTVGIVVSVGPAPQGLKNFEAVYLAHPDPDLGNPSYLSILFWDGIDAYGFSDILTVGSTVACTNLQWRRNAPRVILTAYSTENSTFTRNPRSKYLRSAFDVLRVRVKDTEAYASQCASEIAETLATAPVKASSSVASSSPVPEGCTTPKNPTGISTMKSSIRRRFEKLQWYGEPPNLTPIKSFNSSAKVNQKFVSPLRTPNKTRCPERRVDAPSADSASPVRRTSECKSTEHPL